MVKSSALINCGGCVDKGKSLSKRLRHTIVIQQKATTYDSMGQQSNTWSTYGTVKAAVEPLRGNEFFTANQHASKVSVRIRIRYLSGVTAGMRVSFESRYYDIEAVIDPEERHEEMQLMCSEGVSDG